MSYEIKSEGVTIHSWISPGEVEKVALEQLLNVASLSCVKYVVALPNIHNGYGTPVGSVIATSGAILPCAVGVDVGCGVSCGLTNLSLRQIKDRKCEIYEAIRSRVPVGFMAHSDSTYLKAREDEVASLFEDSKYLIPSAQDRLGSAKLQLGTLGSGGHFIELSVDPGGSVWYVLHAGSRGIGFRVSTEYTKIAKADARNEGLPDRNLSALFWGESYRAYLRDQAWLLRYGALNREILAEFVLDALRQVLDDDVEVLNEVSTFHNYVAVEEHYGEVLAVTRKGAILANQGTPGVIPGTMASKTLIVSGLGNPAALCSASHGVGRRVGRIKARGMFTVDDLTEQTRGVEVAKDLSLVDSAPGAYNDIESVIARQEDLVKPLIELKPVICFKGSKKDARDSG